MSVGFHYCGKFLQDVAWLGKAKPCCMEMPAGCCHDEQLEIKSDTYHVAPPTSNLGFVPVLICDIAFPAIDVSLAVQKQSSLDLARLDESRPPGQDIVIFVQSFLI